MSKRRNEFLDAGTSESDNEEGYDSEAAEHSKITSKRRRLSSPTEENNTQNVASDNEEKNSPQTDPSSRPRKVERKLPVSTQTVAPSTSTKPSKATKCGVIYLSSLPPYLKPSALRNLLTQRGFSPVTRLFLAPSTKAKNHHSTKKSSRQLYSEGWIEFASKKTAKRCAETLNATTVGGRKGGFYHDDIWNMKYLRGVGWDDLMAQVREERREEEVRRTEERGQIARETKEFIEGVETGKMARGIQNTREKKRKKKSSVEAGIEDGKTASDDPGERRTWRQYRVKGSGSGQEKGARAAISDDVKRVLSKIF